MSAEVGYQKESRPHITLNHVDGPMLCMRDGRVHWLTWRERIALFFGKIDALDLERKHWNRWDNQ